jgi:hypothetical protein
LVFDVGVGNVGFGFSKFGLAKFHNGAKAEVVARLRQFKGEAGLFPELLGDRHAFVGAVGVLPGISNVTRDVVSKVGKLLTIGFCSKIGDLGASVVQESIENGNVNIQADGAVPVWNMVVAKGASPTTPRALMVGRQRSCSALLSFCAA